MSLILLDEAQSRVSASITQDHIDEAEEWLTAKIGPLTGERTETFYHWRRRRKPLIVDGLYLKRSTDTVVVTSDGATLVDGTDYRFFDHILVERIGTGAVWGEVLTVTYTPNDEETVRSILFDALAFRQSDSESNLQSVRIGAYSETYFPASQSRVEASLLARALPGQELGALYDPFRYAIHRRDRTLVTGSGS